MCARMPEQVPLREHLRLEAKATLHYNSFDYANECRNEKNSSGDNKHVTFAMTCYENSEEEKY